MRVAAGIRVQLVSHKFSFINTQNSMGYHK
jgi:hypothetical protein